jgi:hypothetical protein
MRPETTKELPDAFPGNKFSNYFKGAIQKEVSMIIFSLRPFKDFQNLKI